MKSFDLEKAKAGKQVCTRDGRPVRIVDFNIKSETYPILALIDNGREEIPQTYTKNGKWNNQEQETSYDLFMKETKKRGWINIYRTDSGECVGPRIWPTRDEAIKSKASALNTATTIKIEWNE